MNILGIETSCDETAASVVSDGRVLLSNVIASQIDIHKAYGGVVPEIAARSHIEVMLPVVNEALESANCTWDDIDAIAVTHGPGLLGSLLIGTLSARTLSLVKNKPLYGVNHVLGHIYANWLLENEPQFPVLALVVSGGHSQLVLIQDHFKYRLLGQTQDDAVGEAFDKVAKIIGLEYPGGPAIATAALKGDPSVYNLPIAKLQNPYDFSFSGLKTAVLRQVQKICGKDYTFESFRLAELLKPQQVADIAASFQFTAVKTLVDATIKAQKEFSPKSVIIGGGVAASKELRRQLSERLPFPIDYADIKLCTDNAAMIATLGYYEAIKRQPDNALTLEVAPNLKM